MDAFLGSSFFLISWLAAVLAVVPLLMRWGIKASWRSTAFMVVGLLAIMSPKALGSLTTIGEGWLVAAGFVLAGACLLQSVLEHKIRWGVFGADFGRRYRLFGSIIAIAGTLFLVGFVENASTMPLPVLMLSALAVSVAAFTEVISGFHPMQVVTPGRVEVRKTQVRHISL